MYVRETDMFHRVVIYECYDGQKKLGHVIPNEDLLAMLREGGSSHLGNDKENDGGLSQLGDSK
jgi:hypothetical protein